MGWQARAGEQSSANSETALSDLEPDDPIFARPEPCPGSLARGSGILFGSAAWDSVTRSLADDFRTRTEGPARTSTRMFFEFPFAEDVSDVSLPRLFVDSRKDFSWR